MNETIFGLSIVETIIFIAILGISGCTLYRIAWQVTAVAMEMAPWVIGLVVIAVFLFVGLMTVRGIQWSLMQ